MNDIAHTLSLGLWWGFSAFLFLEELSFSFPWIEEWMSLGSGRRGGQLKVLEIAAEVTSRVGSKTASEEEASEFSTCCCREEQNIAAALK